MSILSPLFGSSRLVACCLLAFSWAVSDKSQAQDHDLVDKESDPVALFFNAYPVLATAGSTASLKYYVAETCGTRRSGDCEMFEFRCSTADINRFDLLFWGLNVGHVNFSGTITSGYELPHVIYPDRLVERHRGTLLDPPSTDPHKAKQIVKFHFKSGKSLREKGEHAFLIQWDTQSEDDAEELAAMLSSGETVLAPYPVRLRRLMYKKLHPKDDTDKTDVARDFVAACHKFWGERQ